MAMKAKEYDDLTDVGPVNDTDVLAFARPGNVELVKGPVSGLVQKVAADIAGGPLAVYETTVGTGISRLAQTLREKGQNVPNNATFLQLDNATRALDVQGTQEFWVTDFMSARSLDVNNVKTFAPVYGTDYIIWVDENKQISIEDMSGQKSFPSARHLTHDASASTFAPMLMGLAVSSDRRKIAYLKNETTLVVLHIDYTAWTLTAEEYTVPSIKAYSHGYGAINNEGSTYLLYTGYTVWTALEIQTGKQLTISGKNDDSAAIFSTVDWLAWMDEKTAYAQKYNSTQLIKVTVDFNTDTATWVNSGVYTGWENLNTSQFPLHFYADRKLLFRGDAYASNKNDVSYGLMDAWVHLYFLETNTPVEFRVRFRSWGGKYITYVQTSDIFIREKDEDTLLIQVGDIGTVEYKISTNSVIGTVVRGETNVYEGCAVGANDSGGSAQALHNVYVNADGSLVLGSPQLNINSYNYLAVSRRLYQNKIAGYYLYRNYRYSLQKFDVLTQAMLDSGAYDVKDTILTIEDPAV